MIRTTARALLVQDGQVLAIKYQEDFTVYYALPGGGQHPGEPLHRTLQRECREELGIDVHVGALRFVREWLDTERAVHQIEFIFQCSTDEKIGAVRSDIPDGGQIGIEWLPIADLMRFHLYPLEMRHHVPKLGYGEAKAPVYLGHGG
ncbi:NUDIX domain-containing protein [Sulfobacillus harzensis]|uniref:NUDIX domain-containing protein n=1 Tax=Sulfobacillus harzensis TaxID=2729629 RepID=A0A7Y0Q522_9FIRM|nr:NUDIX domain-containing protein [Sulfobacillus harzensis]NMP24631.1 NUDIX domain-containing protein [Sulfobacillus harzensis]